MAEKNKKDLNHEMFTNKDGYVEGGVEVEILIQLKHKNKKFKVKEKF